MCALVWTWHTSIALASVAHSASVAERTQRGSSDTPWRRAASSSFTSRRTGECTWPRNGGAETRVAARVASTDSTVLLNTHSAQPIEELQQEVPPEQEVECLTQRMQAHFRCVSRWACSHHSAVSDAFPPPLGDLSQDNLQRNKRRGRRQG